VGSGLGSVLGGSGKQYFILEHKNSSKFHRVGESQEIIVDQIEIGRDPKCQVRFDDSFTTVSRRHAAIVRYGDKWKLIQLSTTNPTFLNGVKVENEWFLQNGDEIQLAAGGPKLGFIMPQGNKSSVGSLKLTRRLSLFRQQALQPYKTAITLLSILLCLVVLGSVGWGYYSYTKQEKLLVENERLGTELNELNKKAASIEDKSSTEYQEVVKQTEAVAAKLAQSNSQLYAENRRIRRDFEDMQSQMDEAPRAATPAGRTTSGAATSAAARTGSTGAASESGAAGIHGEALAGTREAGGNAIGNALQSARDINSYSGYVFAIQLEKTEVKELNGRSHVIIEPLPKLVGTGFLLNDGRFVTARHVVEPWFYYNVKLDYSIFDVYNRFRLENLNQIANNGGTVVAHYTAVSSSGKRIAFNSSLARINRTTDKVESQQAGRRGARLVRRTAVLDDTDWAVYQTLERSGYSHDRALSMNLDIGTVLSVQGYPWGRGADEAVQVTPIYSTCNVARNGLDVNGTIMVSNDNTERGNDGGPVTVVSSDGTYQVIGILSGSSFAKGRIVPISVVYSQANQY
jgi:pSer/pThr/pTyr-binding forkhead associated (FHA) protein